MSILWQNIGAQPVSQRKQSPNEFCHQNVQKANPGLVTVGARAACATLQQDSSVLSRTELPILLKDMYQPQEDSWLLCVG